MSSYVAVLSWAGRGVRAGGSGDGVVRDALLRLGLFHS